MDLEIKKKTSCVYIDSKKQLVVSFVKYSHFYPFEFRLSNAPQLPQGGKVAPSVQKTLNIKNEF